MSDELDDAEPTRLTLKAQAQRLEALVANLEAELEEAENPATRVLFLGHVVDPR